MIYWRVNRTCICTVHSSDNSSSGLSQNKHFREHSRRNQQTTKLDILGCICTGHWCLSRSFIFWAMVFFIDVFKNGMIWCMFESSGALLRARIWHYVGTDLQLLVFYGALVI